MVQFVGRNDIDFSHTKVMMNVLIFGVDYDVWMTNRIFTDFVDPQVEGRDVSVKDLFSLSFIGNMMEFDSIGSTSEEGISGLQRVNYFEGREKLL